MGSISICPKKFVKQKFLQQKFVKRAGQKITKLEFSLITYMLWYRHRFCFHLAPFKTRFQIPLVILVTFSHADFDQGWHVNAMAFCDVLDAIYFQSVNSLYIYMER